MYKLQTQRNDEGACRMKKWIYLLIVTVTIYLNLLYEWKEGGSADFDRYVQNQSGNGGTNQCAAE